MISLFFLRVWLLSVTVGFCPRVSCCVRRAIGERCPLEYYARAWLIRSSRHWWLKSAFLWR